jgi:hypothetical protein
MSGAQVVGLVFAIFAVVGACFTAFLLMRVTELLLTVKRTMTTVTGAALPLLEQAEAAAKTGDAGMAKVAAITEEVQAITDNVNALAGTASAAVGGRVVRVASFSLGVRKVITSRRHPDRAKQVKAELAADRRARRKKQ